MDPISILSSLASLAQVLQTQYQQFNELQDAKDEGLLKFTHACRSLQDDLAQYQVLLESCIHTGSSATLSAVLRSSSGKRAFDDLENALQHAQTDLLRLSANIPKVAETVVPKTDFQRVLAPAVLPGRTRTVTSHISVVTRQITLHQAHVARTYKTFYSLYQFHDKPPINRNRSSQISATVTHAFATDAVLHAFDQYPFCISAKEIGARPLARLNRDHDVAQEHTKHMIAEGKAWVNDQLDVESVATLGQIQTRLLEQLWTQTMEQVKSRASWWGSGDQETKMLDELEGLEEALKSAIVRAKNQHFAIAFCGMVKAGKSLFLNALMGRTLLPSDELPSTAMPCRLRHVKGQNRPKLFFDASQLDNCLAELQHRRYGERLKSYVPPTDDPFADLLSDAAPPTSPTQSSQEDLSRIYSTWIDLHKNTKINLLRFEDPKFRFALSAEGNTAVTKLLNELSDLCRLCHRFGIYLPMERLQWPVLSVEFDSLRDHKIEGIFEFIDLPGLGEGFDEFTFEDLVRRVAKEANAVVPVVSFKEIPKEDWKQLPQILFAGLGSRANLVICTHFDQISSNNLPEQRANVEKVFWPQSTGLSTGIVPCSSLMGLSAYQLLRRSLTSLPKLETFWDPKQIEYFCAAKILGVGNTEHNYKSFNLSTWQRVIKKELAHSGLPDALSRLTADMVAQARQRALLMEGAQLCRGFHNITTSQRRALLSMRRTKHEFEEARQEWLQARSQFQDVLNNWEAAEVKRDHFYNGKLREMITRLEDGGLKTVQQALHATCEMPGWSQSVSSNNSFAETQRSSETDSAESHMLVVESAIEVEAFVRTSQDKLADLLKAFKRKFVAVIRQLAERARNERFDSLKSAIKSFKDDSQSELKNDILVDLESRDVSIRSIVTRSVRKTVKTQRIRYGAKQAFRSLESAIASPLVSAFAYDDYDNVGVEDLGFMVRAPIAVVAALSWTLGAPIWAVMTQTKKYHINLETLDKRYQDEIVKPFIADLRREAIQSLKGTMRQSSNMAREIVQDALKEEDARYEKESAEKDVPPSEDKIAFLVADYSNCIAAEAAFTALRERLEKYV